MSFDPNDSSLKAQHIAQTKGTLNMRQVLQIFCRRHFSPYKVLVHRESHTVVILNPKVGTTSFRQIASQAFVEVLGHKTPSRGRYKLIRKARYFPFASPSDYFHAFSHPQEYQFYCFVRNPYARLKSSWVDKFANGHEMHYPRSIRGGLLSNVRHFARRRQLPGSEKNSLVPFATFVSYVNAQMSGTRNHHWDTQYEVLMADVIHYAQIFKMETEFSEGMISIFKRMGIQEDWTKQAMQKPSNQSKKVKSPLFTPELAKTAECIYAHDFQFFKYDINSWEGM